MTYNKQQQSQFYEKYQFLEAHSFLRAKLEKNCERLEVAACRVSWNIQPCLLVRILEHMFSTDKYPYILSRKIEAIVFIMLELIRDAREKVLTNSWLYAACDVLIWVLSGTT